MTLFQILLAILTVIITIFVWKWFKNLRKEWKFYKSIPGPKGLPLIGNALELNNLTTLLDVLQRYDKQFNGFCSIQIGLEFFILVSDYKFLEFLLGSNQFLTKSADYRFLQGWLGTGLLTSEGQKWRSHRKILTPAFHFKILEEFVDIFEHVGDIMIKKLKSESNKQNINIYSFVTLCTLDIICETAMGTTVNAQEFKDSEYVRSVKEMCRIIMERAFSPLNSVYALTPNYYQEQKALKVLHNYTKDVIKARKEQLKNRKSYEKEAQKGDDLGIKKKMAFLDILLQATIDGRPLTDDEIREEVDTFMFEGHDTTASGISFTLYALANHPEIQEKAYKEQQGIFGDDIKNPTVTYNHLQDMKYLEAIIKETLRLYPSVPMYSRTFSEDTEFDGLKIPAGVNITIYAYGAHRNPKYFPDPETFKPERFEDIDGRHPYAYIPFSAGPRNCIGQKFAMLEMKSTISKMLRTFKLGRAIPEHSLILIPETVLKSANGMMISLKNRY